MFSRFLFQPLSYVPPYFSSIDEEYRKYIKQLQKQCDPENYKEFKHSGYAYSYENNNGNIKESFKDLATGETKTRESVYTPKFKPLYKEEIQQKKQLKQETSKQLLQERDTKTKNILNNLVDSRDVLAKYHHGTASLEEVRKQFAEEEQKRKQLLQELEELESKSLGF